MSEVNSKSAAGTTARKRLAPPIAAVFAVLGDEHHRYRVTGYYKRVERPQNMTWIDDILWDAEDRGENHVMVVHCRRDGAEFVSGSGVAGTIRRIEDIQVVGMVQWTPEQIREAQQDYERDLSHPHPRFFEPLSLFKYWEEKP